MTKASLKVKLEPIHLEKAEERDWLYSFIHSYHSAPKFILPSQEDLKRTGFRFFKAITTAPKEFEGNVVGITAYEVRTAYLAETQKTIIDPKFRGLGLGKVLSLEIEEEVKRAGFYKIRSCIYSSNLAMIQIKLAQGYIIEGFHPDHDGPGLHEYSLGKVIRRDRRTSEKEH